MSSSPIRTDSMDATIVTTADFNEDKFKLLQLNPDIEHAITIGSKIVIVGAKDARAVLCTEDKSFYIKKEDTSNLRLLTTHMHWSGSKPKQVIHVSGAARFHYLLEPKAPNVLHLRDLLLESPYDKPRRDANASKMRRLTLEKVYSTQALMDKLQVSERQVLQMLQQVHAFEEAGAWRLLARKYETQVFTDMLDTIVQQEWDVFSEPGVAVHQFVAQLKEPLVAIRQCCHLYGDVKSVNGEDRCTLDPIKVATFRAMALLQEQADETSFQAQHEHVVVNPDAGWALDQFLDKWKLRVPERVPVNLDMLRGLVLVKPPKGGKNEPRRIVYFPEQALSPVPKQRFDQLFAMQEKWTLEQLEPYVRYVSLVRKKLGSTEPLRPLVTPNRTQASLLLKYTRSSRPSNSTEKLYSRR
ncbi:hypothetical protein PsorP6_007056 [Peronosclerospora sorghi]|uniref:Uncharacterized protein n=1 Tax=Peronosclerospora sorghi TaxID=230839 RepID=A0ACC0WBZ2_9STRA|nr:hypothetical protein PsorP6_007056 [Peronosclerospora sorghi]